MSRSCLVVPEVGGERCLWLDDWTFHTLMQVFWCCARSRGGGTGWTEFRENCYTQVCIPGFGVLDGGLPLLDESQRSTLAAILDDYASTAHPTASIDVKPLVEELTKRGDADVEDWRPDPTDAVLLRLLPLVADFIRGDAGGPVGSEASHAWSEHYDSAYGVHRPTSSQS